MSRPAGWPMLGLSALVYLGLCAFTVQSVGLVGEVAIGWALTTPPRVLSTVPAPALLDDRWGPFVAAATRPTERIAGIPLAINAYTGGGADLPALAATRFAGSPESVVQIGRITHVALGLLLLTLMHRFLRFHGTLGAAGVAAMVLATDWGFVFYRKVLGGTEVLLLTGGLLAVWALWSRRWKGGVHGTLALAAGVGFGLHAKVTFVATLAALAAAMVLTRWDHGGLKPPRAVHRGWLVGIPVVAVSPLILAFAHHQMLPDDLRVVSHDTLDLQFSRLFHPGAARESLDNLWIYLGDPLAWFSLAFGGPARSAWEPLRLLGWVGVGVGTALEWRARTASPSAALLRFLSLAVPIQLILLYTLNHDLHHLAQSTVLTALWIGLSVDRLAGAYAPPRSLTRTALSAIFAAPFLITGVAHLRETDAVITTLPASTFRERDQLALLTMLRTARVERLVTSDYELYGMLDVRAPEIAITHTWGAMSRGERDLPALLELAEGGDYLTVRPTAPMIYNWRPNVRMLEQAAQDVGVEITKIDELTDGGQAWAELWSVHSKTIPRRPLNSTPGPSDD